MLEENSGSESQENTEQVAQSDAQDSGQNLTDSLNQEKHYSQKQRQRAQKAEAELEKMIARNKKIEEDSMVEQNKFKELYERDKIDAEWARDYKKSKKATLIEKLPEDKRDKFKSLDLISLEAVVDEFFNAQTSKETMKAVPGQVNTPQLKKPYGEMTDEERRAYHGQIVGSRK